MKIPFRCTARVSLFLVPVFILANIYWKDGSARGSMSTGPLQPTPLVRFTGTLYGAEGIHSAENTSNHLPMFIRGEKWLFEVQDVLNLTGTGRGSSILVRLFPMELHLVGPRELLALLENRGMSGKPLVIYGYLYAASGRLLVTEVRTNQDETR